MKFIVSVLLLGASVFAFGYTFDSDVPQDVQNQITQDLDFMKSLSAEKVSPLHKQIFGEMRGPAYYEWFTSRVTAVGMSDCGSPIAVACVIPFFDPSKIWLTQNYVKFSHPQVAKMMVVYHEGRHTEVAHSNWPHASCPTPFVDKDGAEIKSIWTGSKLAGEPACDQTPLGSYGSSTIMLKNISKYCSNCTEKVKMDAGLYADDQFKRIISADAIAQMKKDVFDAETK